MFFGRAVCRVQRALHIWEHLIEALVETFLLLFNPPEPCNLKICNPVFAGDGYFSLRIPTLTLRGGSHSPL
ncbi:hypothetical protein Mapa_010767 [Marchantia paleacea]|nr:hypothetical protein Mapa_010767 [Marchantia paleacea]